MGKSKKNLDQLKKDLKTLKKVDMNKIVGGKNDKKKKKWRNPAELNTLKKKPLRAATILVVVLCCL